MVRFYVGLHHPSDARHFDRCMVSVNTLRRRRSDFVVGDWMMDSGAFTSVARDGGYTETPEDYAAQIDRWSRCGNLVAAVSQDWMCEPFVLERTGKTVKDHQDMTIDRYIAIRRAVRDPTIHIMPVLQGYHPREYVDHLKSYGGLLRQSAWVGVGSVCKRNSKPDAIVEVLAAIKDERPDLKLHGFGIKLTALSDTRVQELLYSADSMAWSFAARREGRNANDWREADTYRLKVEARTNKLIQAPLLFA